MKIVLATFNQDKLREMRELLQLPGLVLTALCDVPGATAPVEGGESLAENARLKARAALDLSGMPAIADDTGLEVDALGGRPGIHAARYAGPGATYADNLAKLLAELANVTVERRGARFRTVCVALFPDGGEVVAEGVLEGCITLAPRGANGFGYDPVFEVMPLGRTLAELSDREKNALSHRGRAARALARQLADRAAPR
ncbi:MAG: RdgB/HAM1 family non-canonical purine NTP pyrophosphatase [Candidatus Eisenbacteria bacterium]|nr:RdgB/HAM1 family non-canonical purine NTP pyrophosphatase [Candidatus Eisenbacteria bacterium]